MKMGIEGLFYFTSKKVGKAIWDYRMIGDGDNLLIAVSGGKDSLTLSKIMKERTRFVPIKYKFTACYVDMGFDWVDKERLVSFFAKEAVPFIVIDPPEGWDSKGPFNCFWCSWNRRKALFELAHKMGFNKIAFAHHMDDIIETILLNLFFQGEIATMTPYQELFNGELAIIRPFAYVEEKDIERLSPLLELPVMQSRCPYGNTSKRAFVKRIIEEVRHYNKNVKKNIFRSLQRIRKEHLL
jgi:tRNA 2-thiocytidine biosynthesis protein TtcA